jgi:hypothetical protein
MAFKKIWLVKGIKHKWIQKTTLVDINVLYVVNDLMNQK